MSIQQSGKQSVVCLFQDTFQTNTHHQLHIPTYQRLKKARSLVTFRKVNLCEIIDHLKF